MTHADQRVHVPELLQRLQQSAATMSRVQVLGLLQRLQQSATHTPEDSAGVLRVVLGQVGSAVGGRSPLAAPAAAAPHMNHASLVRLAFSDAVRTGRVAGTAAH